MNTPAAPDSPSPEPSDPAPARPAPRLPTADRQQTFLRPTEIEDLLPADHRARVIGAFVAGLDLSAVVVTIKSVAGHAGAPAIDSQILLAVWMYAISEGVGQARALDRLCASQDAYRWIRGGVTVNYSPSEKGGEGRGS